MESKKNTLTLDLKDRYSDSHAVIHATDAHWAIAQVVVRMDGETEDSPILVKFAHELVNRYNQYDEIESRLAIAEKALTAAGYTQLSPANDWKPPIGPSAYPLLQRIDKIVEQRDELLAALQRLISSDPHIEMFPTSELEICANNEALPPTLREQAASVIQARAVIAIVKVGAA